MRYTRLLLIIIVGLALVVGCSGTKQDSKATKKSANNAIDFKTLQLNDNPSDPNWVDTCITYAGYAYTNNYGSETGTMRPPAIRYPAQGYYIGQYGDTKFYVSKAETQTPPLWLWATEATYFIGPIPGFKRLVKLPQGKPQMLRSVASDSKFRLSFVMPKQSYTTGRLYVTHAVLTPTNRDHLPSIGPLLEVVVLDMSGNVVSSQSSSLDQPAARVRGEGSGGAPLPIEHTYNKVGVVFNKPGTYRVVCRTIKGTVQHIKDPTIRDALRDLATEPIEITVR